MSDTNALITERRMLDDDESPLKRYNKSYQSVIKTGYRRVSYE